MRDSQTEGLRVQIYRRLSPGRRVEIAVGMCEDAISLVRASILYRNPGISAADLEFEVRRRVLPSGLAELSEAARRARDPNGA